MFVQRIARHPYRGWGLAFLAFLAFAMAAAALARWRRTRAPVRLTVASGVSEGQRSETLARFALLSAPHGLILRPVETSGSADAIERVDSGALDIAVVQGGIDFSGYPNIRQVTSLQVLPLHLLVKEEIADEVTTHLGALRGKVVNLGTRAGTGTYRLAREVLAFAGLDTGGADEPGDYHASTLSSLQLAAEDDRARLPDAIFVVASLPSPFVRLLVEQRRYRLVPLLFRDAFTLAAMYESVPDPARARRSDRARGSTPEADRRPILLREQIADTVIPAFTYQADPGVPAAPLHTLGVRALLIANRRVEADVVARLLEVLFQTRFAKIVQPPLDIHRLEEIPEVPWHPGSVAYLERSKPVLTGEFVSELVNLCSIAGPIIGGMFVLWQYIRRRSRFRSEQSFEAYITKVSALEHAALERENDAPLDQVELERLWLELGQLKAEAVGKFARGEITGEAMLTSFLTHVGDARAHLAHVIEPPAAATAVAPKSER